MENPWGISGPAFVWVFLGLLIVPLVVRGILRTAAKRITTPRAAHGHDAYPLSVYHLAYLAGGPNRTVETVIAALVERGQLRVNSRKKLKTVGMLPSDPLERAVGEAADDAVGSSTFGVQNWVRSSEPMKAFGVDLERRGLVVPGTRYVRIGRTVAVLYLAIFAIGVARLVNGLTLGRPAGLLVVLLIVNLVVLVVTASTSSRHGLVLTPAGRRVLARARSESRRSPQAPASPGPWGMPLGGALVGAAGLVALGGLAMHPDRDLGLALAPPPMSGGGGSSSSGDSGGSSCSSGSSCGGGGGCGGGGCGG
jgi:uncharacterized protein (TIGR04222 family)